MDTQARVKHLIGTTAEWAAHDLVAGEGEMVLEQATGGVVKAKLGDGVSKFSQLVYFGGLSTMPLGTVALPGLPFTGDADTGFFSPGANLLSIATQGIERLRVFGDGGITMTQPSIVVDTLTVNAVIGANALTLTAAPTGLARMGFWNSSVRNWGLGTGAGDTFTLRDATRAVDVLTVDAAGNFGIASGAVAAPVVTWGSVGVNSGARVVADLSYKTGVVGPKAFLQVNAGNFDDIYDLAFLTAQGGAPQVRMRIDAAGNVGIGGAAEATYKLQVNGNGPGTFDPAIYRPLANFFDAGSSGPFGLTLGSHPTSGNQDQGGYVEATSSLTMRAGFFWIWQTIGGVERMRIDAVTGVVNITGSLTVNGVPVSRSDDLTAAVQQLQQQIDALLARVDAL